MKKPEKEIKKEIKIQYIVLKHGDKIQKNDEFCSNEVWRVVPDFLVGEIIQQGETRWRRRVVEEVKGKKWFWF